MLEYLDQLDRAVLLYLNGLHSDTMDEVMVFISGKWSWLPLYVFIIGYTALKYKKKSWIYIGAIFLTFVLTDVISSQVFKKGIKRFRPSHNVEITEQLHLPDGKGGKYGFFSSHAANTFGLAMFLCLLFYKERRVWCLMLFWAFVVSYSRIYLGKHYPLDILCGALFGVLMAIFVKRIIVDYLLKKLQ